MPAAALRGLANSGSPGVLALAVHALERRARQVDLAAHFDARPSGPPRSASGIARIVRTFAVTSSPRAAVAARRAAHQPAVLVGQRDAQAVDLHLGDVGDRRVAQAGALPHALVERLQLVVVVGVVEAEHRDEVLDGLESLDRPARDALRRRIGRDEIGMLRFEPLELVQQPIELLVGDLRRVVDVVALFVMADRGSRSSRMRHRSGEGRFDVASRVSDMRA